MAAAGGGPRFSALPSPAFPFPAAAPAPGRASAPLPPRLGNSRFHGLPPPPPPRLVPGPQRPRCPRPRSVRPRCRPHYLSCRPSSTARGPWARAGQPLSWSARPRERSAASSRAGLRRVPARPALGPRPGRRRRRRSRGRRGNGATAAAAAAAATEPGRGEGGISPQAGSAPPASPRHLHPFPRSLPGSAGFPAAQERERERGGKREKNPPARARRGGGRGGAERSAEPPPPPPRGTVPRSASRWRCGLGRGAEWRPGLCRPGPEDKGLAMSIPSPNENSRERPASVVYRTLHFLPYTQWNAKPQA
ncbi:translation initiation factor IF-2-like [Choloepus didactylus]|uniref:translation initiation factor IF-2-like n=1 Tax=Choloepus didactylus TaxID=27675 RepID=UPI00189F2ACC|nr:translation initiation factor IF-2-like [Choloepus didactylus]